MLNTAGAYFIRESGGTFLGDKGHSCHPRIQCKYRYYKRKFQIIRAKKVHKSSHGLDFLNFILPLSRLSNAQMHLALHSLLHRFSPWPFSSKLEWLIWLIEKVHIRITFL